MIARLVGTVIEKKPPFLLLDVQGVGYELESSMTSLYHIPEAGQQVALYTHLWVREDAMRLYAFTAKEERDLFRRLLKVNGIGAKVALAILSNLDPQQFILSVQAQDAAALQRIPGIGKKTAERLLVEMRDSLMDWPLADYHSTGKNPSEHNQISQEAISALMALGYKTQDAQRAVRRIYQGHSSSEELIRQALKEGI